jgi:hypothetical protein
MKWIGSWVMMWGRDTVLYQVQIALPLLTHGFILRIQVRDTTYRTGLYNLPQLRP